MLLRDVPEKAKFKLTGVDQHIVGIRVTAIMCKVHYGIDDVPRIAVFLPHNCTIHALPEITECELVKDDRTGDVDMRWTEVKVDVVDYSSSFEGEGAHRYNVMHTVRIDVNCGDLKRACMDELLNRGYLETGGQISHKITSVKFV